VAESTGWRGGSLWVLVATVLLSAGTPVHLSAQATAITDATIYPVSGPRIERGTIVVQDGRILAVGTDVAVPAGARRIDGRGKVVTPGFIHVQSELGLGVGRALAEENDQEYTAIGGTTDGDQKGDVSAAFNVAAAIDPAAVAIPVARQGGITTALTMPANGLIAGQAVAIHLLGEHTDDLLLASPALMVADLSDQSRSAGGGSRAGALARLRAILRDAQELRRRTAAYTENRIQPLGAPAADLEALYPVLDGKLPLYVRARRQSDIENAVKLAQELRLRLIIRGGTEAWRSGPLLAKAQVPVVIDTRDNIPSFDGLRARSDNATLLREAGVTVILAGQDPGGQMNLRFEAGHAVRNGMKWDDALEAVTLAPAKALGLASRFGSLEPGKAADVVVWSGDPFEFSTGVELLLIDGREAPRSSRMTELLQRYRTLPPKY
jgi:imidazolonepropionase-like amidohydrolase